MCFLINLQVNSILLQSAQVLVWDRLGPDDLQDKEAPLVKFVVKFSLSIQNLQVTQIYTKIYKTGVQPSTFYLVKFVIKFSN